MTRSCGATLKYAYLIAGLDDVPIDAFSQRTPRPQWFKFF